MVLLPIKPRSKRPFAHSKDRYTSSRPQSRTNASKIYKAAVPLVGWEPLLPLLQTTSILQQSIALHQMVIISDSNNKILVYDFLPLNPTNSTIVATLLTGGSVSAETRIRPLSQLPPLLLPSSSNIDKQRYSLSSLTIKLEDITGKEGKMVVDNPHAVAEAFSHTWQRDVPYLTLFSNDCTTFADRLIDAVII